MTTKKQKQKCEPITITTEINEPITEPIHITLLEGTKPYRVTVFPNDKITSKVIASGHVERDITNVRTETIDRIEPHQICTTLRNTFMDATYKEVNKRYAILKSQRPTKVTIYKGQITVHYTEITEINEKKLYGEIFPKCRQFNIDIETVNNGGNATIKDNWYLGEYIELVHQINEEIRDIYRYSEPPITDDNIEMGRCNDTVTYWYNIEKTLLQLWETKPQLRERPININIARSRTNKKKEKNAITERIERDISDIEPIRQRAITLTKPFKDSLEWMETNILKPFRTVKNGRYIKRNITDIYEPKTVYHIGTDTHETIYKRDTNRIHTKTEYDNEPNEYNLNNEPNGEPKPYSNQTGYICPICSKNYYERGDGEREYKRHKFTSQIGKKHLKEIHKEYDKKHRKTPFKPSHSEPCINVIERDGDGKPIHTRANMKLIHERATSTIEKQPIQKQILETETEPIKIGDAGQPIERIEGTWKPPITNGHEYIKDLPAGRIETIPLNNIGYME